jgi:subtilisin family serine protease
MDSGAILVGAGAPPPGMHGVDQWGSDRSRLAFSNYGSALDAQGWGREVTTTGYGTKQGGTNENLWYTDGFAGTSSAAPIVAGALACLQGALRQAAAPLLTPATARQILRTTGSPQQDAPDRPATQRIGNRPNASQMLRQLLPAAAPQDAPDHNANVQPVSPVKSVTVTRTFREKTVTRYYR